MHTIHFPEGEEGAGDVWIYSMWTIICVIVHSGEFTALYSWQNSCSSLGIPWQGAWEGLKAASGKVNHDVRKVLFTEKVAKHWNKFPRDVINA